ELVSVSEPAERLARIGVGQREEIGARRGGGDEHVLPRRIVRLTQPLAEQPPVMQPDERVDLAADVPELMQVAIADPAPVAELHAELEGAYRRLEEHLFVELNSLIE